MNTSTPRVSVSCEIDDYIYSSTVVGDNEFASSVYRLILLRENGGCSLMLDGQDIPVEASQNPLCPCGKDWGDCEFRI